MVKSPGNIKTADTIAGIHNVPNKPGRNYFIRYAIRIVCIVILGILVYSNTLDSPFVFDDEIYVVNNPAIRDFLFDTTKIDVLPESFGVFKTQFRNRIAGHFSFAVNYMIHSLSVTGYHLVNLLIHLLNALLVYLLVMLTFKTPFLKNKTACDPAFDLQTASIIAFLCALLFVAHPMQTQAVTYISQRFTSLATFFCLLSLLLYIRARLSEIPLRRYAFLLISLLSLILAMKTKEISFTLPVIIALYEFMFLEGKLKERIISLAPFLLAMTIIPLTLLYSAPSADMQKGIFDVSKETATITRSDYLFTEFGVIVSYIRLLLLPYGQNIDHDYPVYNSFFTLPVLLPFLLLLLIFVLAVFLLYRSREKSVFSWQFRLISFGILYFFITLSVESSLIPIKDVMFEHRVYLPSFGFFLCLISMAMLLKAKLREPFNKAIIPAMMMIIIVFAGAAYSRNSVWASSFSLWEDSVAKSPLKARPHTNLGLELFGSGNVYAALSEFETAVRLDPNYDIAHHNLGIAYLRLDRLEEAAEEFRAAIKADPNSDDSYLSLGVTLFKLGRYDEAYREFLNAVRVNPHNSSAHYNIAKWNEMNGEFERAIEEYSTAAELKPEDPDTHKVLGMLFSRLDRCDDAIRSLLEALKLAPDDAEIRHEIGVCYLKKNQLDEARSTSD